METAELIEIAILAVISALVLGRLYAVLGQRRGSERRAEPVPAAPSPPAPTPAQSAPGVSGPEWSEGAAAIAQADPRFNADEFLLGARAAYEMIVTAFSEGDVAALQPLLTPRVHQAYAKAIADRAGKGPELVRLRSAEVADATLEGGMARVVVRFEAELAEGEYGVRETREYWTFEREVRSRDPNWLLAGVAQA